MSFWGYDKDHALSLLASGSEELCSQYLAASERVCLSWVSAFEHVAKGGAVPSWVVCDSGEGGKVLAGLRSEAGEINGADGVRGVSGTSMGVDGAKGFCRDGEPDDTAGARVTDSGAVRCGQQLAGSGGDTGSVTVRGPNWARNKRKRERADKRSRAGCSKSSTCEGAAVGSVPEWRRKDPSALVHKGVFSECSVEVQKELRESRARMLVAKNNTALAEAEHRRRTVEARMKARMVEEEVERHRLELAEVNRKLVEAQAARLPVGFAETVASFGLESLVSSPSLSSGSVSPDSSVSVAELKRREAAVVKLIERVTQLQVENEELKKITGSKQETVVVVKPVEEKREEQVLGRQRMPSVEREIRKVRGLPLVGPGSGLGGYSKWD